MQLLKKVYMRFLSLLKYFYDNFYKSEGVVKNNREST